jgi:DNA-directed RNA polymerase subunit M/transcription elongation factor TFIIS
MRFCENCGRAMIRDPSSGAVVFRCPCGVEEKGADVDARVSGVVLGAGETTEMYRRLIQTSPHDRTNQLVKRPCPDCGRDYQVQIRVGDAEVIIYKCKCGHEDAGGAPTPVSAQVPTSAAAAQKKVDEMVP